MIDNKLSQENKNNRFSVNMCYCRKYSKSRIIFDKNDVCFVYSKQSNQVVFYSQMVAIAIVVINIVLRVVNVGLVNTIGYHKNSEIVRTIMQFVFVQQFINTALLLLVTNANFEHTPLAFIYPIRNKYNDFSSEWYQMVGVSIYKTMIIQAFMPYF